ncbi:MAG: CDP-glucose 4,6-dehydratase [Thermoguttaceae bacterium]|jgi:CDP-glucose 4,6-dehydratase
MSLPQSNASAGLQSHAPAGPQSRASGSPQINVFAGRRVLVTGHTGFVGSWLAIWLARLGARVTGYSLPPPTVPSNFVAAGVRRLLASHWEGDLRDVERLERAVRRADPDVVFHLAAQSLVRTGYAQPRETLDVNVIGTAALLDAVRAHGKPCAVVVATSDKCYENREQVWGYRENDPLGGHDPYSASKGAAELVAACYRRSFFDPLRLADHGVKLATARSGNVIGGGDWARDRLVPDAVRSLAAGRPVPVRSPGSVRPWQHVLESLGGYLTLAARMLQSDDPAWCDAWNFGPLPGQELSVAELVERLLAAWGGGTWTDASQPCAPHEAALLRLNIDKSLCRLGWRPAWVAGTAIARTARWYRRCYDAAGSDLAGPPKGTVPFSPVRGGQADENWDSPRESRDSPREQLPDMLPACQEEIDAYESACGWRQSPAAPPPLSAPSVSNELPVATICR